MQQRLTAQVTSIAALLPVGSHSTRVSSPLARSAGMWRWRRPETLRSSRRCTDLRLKLASSTLRKGAMHHSHSKIGASEIYHFKGSSPSSAGGETRALVRAFAGFGRRALGPLERNVYRPTLSTSSPFHFHLGCSPTRATLSAPRPLSLRNGGCRPTPEPTTQGTARAPQQARPRPASGYPQLGLVQAESDDESEHHERQPGSRVLCRAAGMEG